MLNDPTTPTASQVVSQAAAMASMMTPEQRAKMTIAMMIQKVVELLEGPKEDGGFHTIHSPFNPDWPISVIGQRTELDGQTRFAAILFDGDGSAPEPAIIAALYKDAQDRMTAITPDDLPGTPEHVSTARKTVLAAMREIIQTTANTENTKAGV